MWKNRSNVTQFWFLIPYIIFLSFFSVFFKHTFFFLVFSPPHTYIYPQYLSSLFVWLFVFLVISKTFPPSPSLFRSLSLTHTHTNFSPSISHKQILFHACINHWKRTKIRVLPTSKDMQLNHHIDQISVLHVFFFFGSSLISFILLLRFH